MGKVGPKKVQAYEILKFVHPLQKGRYLDPTQSAACARLILDLENERRKLEAIAASAGTTVDAREASWQEIFDEQKRQITELRNANKEMSKRLKSLGAQLINAAEKYQVEPSDYDRRRKPLKP